MNKQAMQRSTNLLVTNLQLLGIALFVFVAVGFPIASHFDGTTGRIIYSVLGITTGAFAAIVVRSTYRAVKDKNSIWWQPVSTRISSLLINSVVSIWLGVVGLMFFLVLKAKESPGMAVTAIFLFLAGVSSGRYLQKRFFSNTLLPYGISFVGVAMVIVIIIFAITRT